MILITELAPGLKERRMKYNETLAMFKTRWKIVEIFLKYIEEPCKLIVCKRGVCKRLFYRVKEQGTR